MATLPAATLAHYVKIVNIRVNTPVTDATPQEVAAAFTTLVKEEGAEYSNKFLKEKDGKAWRLWLDSDDFCKLANSVAYARSAKAAR